MKKLIAKLFGLYTDQDLGCHRKEVYDQARSDSRKFYQKVLDTAHRDGYMPPNCDLKLPKQSLKITNTETNELIAEDGKWKRIPSDGEKVTVSYKHD
jgi:hypothetical protein